jgi:hypothetical protein
LETWHNHPLQFATLVLVGINKRGLAAALFVFGAKNLENSEESPVVSPFASAAKFPIKRRGEIAELAFLLKAVSLGFGVAKPWGDSDRFDFILHCEGRLWRVQVKSAWCGPPYRIKGSGVSNRPYTAAELDFVAGYIVPRDLWYILPLAALASRKIVNIYPDLRTSPFNNYRDAWGLFQNPESLVAGR